MLNKTEITKNEFKKILLKSNSKSDICRSLNFSINKWNMNKVDKLLEKFNLNTSHFDEKKWHKRKYPKIEKECPVCGNKFISIDGSKKYERKFCSKGCGNKFRAGIRYSTKLNPNREEIKIYKCLNCDSNIIPRGINRNSEKKFCNHHCFGQYQRKLIFEKIENGTFKTTSRGNAKNRQLKAYLIEKYGYKCFICGCTEWMGQPIPLQLDHIDGDSDNDNLNNTRNACPNCHAQTPTYCGKNKGRGKRNERLKNYHDGKDKW